MLFLNILFFAGKLFREYIPVYFIIPYDESDCNVNDASWIHKALSVNEWITMKSIKVEIRHSPIICHANRIHFTKDP